MAFASVWLAPFGGLPSLALTAEGDAARASADFEAAHPIGAGAREAEESERTGLQQHASTTQKPKTCAPFSFLGTKQSRRGSMLGLVPLLGVAVASAPVKEPHVACDSATSTTIAVSWDAVDATDAYYVALSVDASSPPFALQTTAKPALVLLLGCLVFCAFVLAL